MAQKRPVHCSGWPYPGKPLPKANPNQFAPAGARAERAVRQGACRDRQAAPPAARVSAAIILRIVTGVACRSPRHEDGKDIRVTIRKRAAVRIDVDLLLNG